jgi:hypothetical protein
MATKKKSVDLEELQESVTEDLKNKKFAFTLPWIIGLFSAVSTVIGGYWYVKKEFESIISDVQTMKEADSPTRKEYDDLKSAVVFLNQQVTQVGTSGGGGGAVPPMILQLNNTNNIKQEQGKGGGVQMPSAPAAQPAAETPAAKPSVNDRLSRFKKQ